MALGILLGVSGVGQAVLSVPAGGILTQAISMVTAPTSALVLLVVGYDLELNRGILRPVVITVVCRLAVMAVLLVAVSFLVFRFVPYDRSLQIALMILYALPAPFIIPMFADVKEEGTYISTTLSLQTICTIVLFAGIAAYSLMLALRRGSPFARKSPAGRKRQRRQSIPFDFSTKKCYAMTCKRTKRKKGAAL